MKSTNPLQVSGVSLRIGLCLALMASACGGDESQPCEDGAVCESEDGSVTGPGRDGAVGDGAIGDGAVGDGAVGDGAVGDGATGNGDGGGEPPVCVPVDGVDEPDVGGVDSDCDGIDGDADQAVFVATTGNDTASGTRDAPVATITRAIAVAVAGGRTQVLVAEGSYVESIVVAAGISIHGGYRANAGWLRFTTAKTTIAAPASASAVVVDGVHVETRLSRLTLRSDDGIGMNASSIAVVVKNSTMIRFEDSIVEAGDGTEGTAGSTPAQPPQAPAGGVGGTAYFNAGDCSSTVYESPEGNPGAGGGGTPPACNRGGSGRPFVGSSNPVSGGWAGASVSGNACVGGTATTPLGQAGTVGSRGADALPGTTGTISAGGFVPDLALSGGPGGAGAGGGGGAVGTHDGRAYGDCGSEMGTICSPAPGGGGGAGGRPGLAGSGGIGGGASIGILVWNATLAMTRVTVRTGAGGIGGAGGVGGLGGLGGAGGSGTELAVWSTHPTPRFMTCPPGGTGGAGGTGGQGGGGGGGSGGPSVGVVLGGGATLASMASVSFQLGAGGVGGAGGGAANAGPTGVARAVWMVP